MVFKRDTPETSPFAFTIDVIEKCNQIGRDVTAPLHHNQNAIGTGYTVVTRDFTAQDNPAKVDLVREGKEEVHTDPTAGRLVPLDR